jgi:hypothetical protein
MTEITIEVSGARTTMRHRTDALPDLNEDPALNLNWH